MYRFQRADSYLLPRYSLTHPPFIMSITIPAFDPLSIPIAGINLIEASAGTGKTYGIAALFTRLVVLEQMPVESILTVTFTKAATAELKTRLRARLDEVLQALESV